MTPREQKVLTYIDAYIRKHGGVSPTYRNIAKHLGQKSPSGAHEAVSYLIDYGYVKRHPIETNTLVVITNPARGGTKANHHTQITLFLRSYKTGLASLI